MGRGTDIQIYTHIYVCVVQYGRRASWLILGHYSDYIQIRQPVYMPHSACFEILKKTCFEQTLENDIFHKISFERQTFKARASKC